MKVLVLTNNPITSPLIDWLRRQNEDVIVSDKQIKVEDITSIKPDFIISYNYLSLIPKEVILKMPPKTIINLHTSLLPWNRGVDPNIWSFISDTPKGVSIHLIDEGLDSGDILYQRQLYFHIEKETLGSTFLKLHKEIQALFIKHWNTIKNRVCRIKRQKGNGSIHYKRDLVDIRNFLGNEIYDIPIIELINKLKTNKLSK